MIANDFVAVLLFGLLSVAFGWVRFQMPDVEGSYSDFREIPLLISVFYIQNPVSILVLSVFSIIGIPEEVPALGNYAMHVLPLLFAWGGFKFIEGRLLGPGKSGLVWAGISFLYYACFLIPIMIFSYQLLGINTDVSFREYYASVFFSVRFEIISAALVSALFLVQFKMQKSLVAMNRNLRLLVKERTKELEATNEKLSASHEEVVLLNENLEKIVQERTHRINQQFEQLRKYTHMNAQEVRGPLARILGILELLKVEQSNDIKQELIRKLYQASEELDSVVKQMNKLLENEIPNT